MLVVQAALLCLALAEAPPPTAAPASAFDLDPRKRLSPDDDQRKNERGYVTGLPLAAYDPNFGVGAGARAYYYWNGSRGDALFSYTPYFHRIFLQGFASTRGLQFHWLDYDAPYFLNTALRLRGQLIYERNLVHNYFDTGSDALGALVSPVDGRRYPTMAGYDASRTTAGDRYAHYDQVDLERPLAFLSVERTFLSGTVRPLGGFMFSRATIRDYGKKPGQDTRLERACAAGREVGCNGGWDNGLRLGLSYDTRDFEPDPNSGVFFDVALDLGSAILGSDYTYARALASGRVYYSPMPELADFVLALRATFEVQTKDTPFFSMDLMPWTEDPRSGMGGLRSMRGFLQDRFVGPVMALVNVEARWTFYHFGVLGQRFALIAVPFADVGRPFDDVASVSYRHFKADGGAGLRIAWNQATIVCIDYGKSSEGTGLYVNFNHIF